MAFRPTRTPTFRPQLSVRRVYENFQPQSEMKQTPEAYLLHVYLPGFTKDRIKITFVGSSQMVRITGERQFGSNRWRRFDQTYPVPENGDAETLEGKFELGTLILTIKKKKAQEESPAGPLEKVVAEPKPEEEAQETNPPQSTTTKVEDKKSDSLPSPVQGPADFKSQKDTHQEDTSPQLHSEPIRDHSPQKGQEEIEPKSTPTIQTDEKSPNGPLEEVEPKPATLTTFNRVPVEEKMLDTVKEQLEEKKVGMSGEYMEKGDLKEKEIQTRKLSSKEDETSASKFQEKEKVSSSRVSPNQQGKNGEDMFDVIGNGIRNLAASSSKIVTRIAEGKLNDEEKQLVSNIGVAILVIVVWGAYASYKFAS